MFVFLADVRRSLISENSNTNTPRTFKRRRETAFKRILIRLRSGVVELIRSYDLARYCSFRVYFFLPEIMCLINNISVRLQILLGLDDSENLI